MYDFVLTDDLRKELKQPLGRVIKGAGIGIYQEIREELSRYRLIVSVGDITTYYLLEARLYPWLIVVDHRTKRKSLPKKYMVKDMDMYQTVEVENPPGILKAELIDAMKGIFERTERTKLDILGEEDLSTLPVIRYAPVSSVVLYGQPSEGVVLVEVTEEMKNKVEKLFNRMKKVARCK